MQLDARQRRVLNVLLLLTGMNVAFAWNHGWPRVVGMVIVGVVLATFFLAVTFYADRGQRRASRLASGQQ